MAAGSSGARMLRDLVSLKNEQMFVRIKILIKHRQRQNCAPATCASL